MVEAPASELLSTVELPDTGYKSLNDIYGEEQYHKKGALKPRVHYYLGAFSSWVQKM